MEAVKTMKLRLYTSDKDNKLFDKLTRHYAHTPQFYLIVCLRPPLYFGLSEASNGTVSYSQTQLSVKSTDDDFRF